MKTSLGMFRRERFALRTALESAGFLVFDVFEGDPDLDWLPGCENARPGLDTGGRVCFVDRGLTQPPSPRVSPCWHLGRCSLR